MEILFFNDNKVINLAVLLLVCIHGKFLDGYQYQKRLQSHGKYSQICLQANLRKAVPQ